MNLVRPILAFSAVLLFACNKSPEVAGGSSKTEIKVERKVWSKAERDVTHKVERVVASTIGGIDVSKLEGWAELPSEGRVVVADFIREARTLDPEWLELQRAMNAANEAKQFVAAVDRFTAALIEWLPEYSTAQVNLRTVDGLSNAEEFLSAKLQSESPDLNAIVGKVGEVYEKFSDDSEVRVSLQKLTPVVDAIRLKNR